MNQTDIIAKLQVIFDEIFLESPTLVPTLTANEVSEWDSLIHISLLVAVEKQFAIRFRVGEAEAMKNIGEFADLIIRRLTEK